MLHRTLRDRRLAYRLNAIVLLGSGWSIAAVAEALLVDETTIRSWQEKYQQGGEEGLLTVNYQGKSPSLPDEQQEEPATHLDENMYLDSKAIRHHIKKTYGMQYSSGHVLKSLN
ncbi:hypothetical protein AGMMS50229_20730 [Campylobacterota bacterium]|nr:hypothetical protein AGMMS50229_20730 [Campylobacterota bacterium]